MTAQPYLFQDFERATRNMQVALSNGEVYTLLTGETGCGKTLCLAHVRAQVEHGGVNRIAYYATAQRLGPSGLVNVLARRLRTPIRRTYVETHNEIARALGEDGQRLWLWIDEAHELPDATFTELRALAEGDLGGSRPVSILLSGLPLLRERLAALPSVWRRFVVREQITGLVQEEMAPFVAHVVGPAVAGRLTEEGLDLLFHRGRGLPGQILPLVRTVIAREGTGPIGPAEIDDTASRWDLT